jgi:arylsulfatase A-like enzyme
VRWADDYVGGIVELLKRSGKWDNTLFILLADHGEEMGEHGGWQHDQSVYEELGRIPFIVKLPRGLRAGERVTDDVATVVDVIPTIAEALDWPGLSLNTRGRPAAPRPDGDGPRIVTMRHNRKKFFRPWKEQRGDLNLAIRDGRWKGIWNVEPDTFELYDLAADPGERTNRAAEQPDVVAALRKHAGAWLNECSARAVDAAHGGLDHLDEETRRRLISLGYLSETPAPRRPATRPAGAANP